MRLVAWNCNMALHRKAEALLALRPDLAVISECAEPARLRQRGPADWIEGEPVWIGRNPSKGLATFGFNGHRCDLAAGYLPSLRYVAPLRVEGSSGFNLLAVWAQNASGGVTRKRQAGPLRRALSRYRDLLAERPTIIAGDWNNNVIWDRPGWRINHAAAVTALERLGLVSAYHALTGEAQGEESVPTHYWRDRRKDGPRYHIDYVFIPRDWLGRVRDFRVGGFEDWCGNGLSDHVPLVIDLDL